MILPLVTYNCTVNLNFNQTQLNKLASLDAWVTRVLNKDSDLEIVPPKAIDCIRRHSCALVRKCIDKNICSNFHDYFTVRKSGCVTRNSDLLVKLPKCKLEVAKSGFYYTGAKMYNDLPLNIRKEKIFNLFKKLLSLI